MTHTALPLDELEVFKSLTDVQVVIDAGARDDIDYLLIKPGIELHAFEPNPLFFKELQEAVGGRPNVYLNQSALGEKRGTLLYNESTQSLEGSRSWSGGNGLEVKVQTLDAYVKKHGISRIDFLKIDTEGFELQVLKGAKESLKITRYVQYETHTEPSDSQIVKLLTKAGFIIEYTGYRNMLAYRAGERPWIPEELKEGGLTEKNASNYFPL